MRKREWGMKPNQQTRRQQDVLLHAPHPARQAMKKSTMSKTQGKFVMKASSAACTCVAEVKHCSTMPMPMLRYDNCFAVTPCRPALHMCLACFALCRVVYHPLLQYVAPQPSPLPDCMILFLSSPLKVCFLIHVRPSGQEPKCEEEADCCANGLGQQGDLLCNAQPTQRS